MKKILTIIGGITAIAVILCVAVFFFVSKTSEKLVCKSAEGNITIMYNDNTITGYTAVGITYDLDGQKEIAKQIGVEEYMNQFKAWFSENTTGTCE